MRVTVTTTAVTPAASRQLTTATLFKQQMSINDSESDDYIGFLIDACSSAIENYCNRIFARQTLTDAFRIGHSISPEARGVAVLRLTRWPVISVASVTDSTGVVDPTLYEVDPEAGHLRRLVSNNDGTFTRIDWCPGQVSVQYAAGYLLPNDTGRTLPFDIEIATQEFVKLYYKARGRDPMLRSQNEPGLGGPVYWVGTPGGMKGALPASIAGFLDNYTVPVIGL